MNLALLALVVLSAVATSEATCTSSCLIEFPFGRIQGKCNNGMCSFTNVPYALPPTGARRFEAPLPFNETWTGVRDGTKEPIGCIQFSATHIISYPSEDCLVVNIYIPGSGENTIYPVRTYTHGGGFMFGEAGDTDPSLIVKRGMIVVQIGYRLGALGFLSTGDNCIPGNNGLKDQREALRWIKKYIRYFHGDPNKVLLTGFSAGGASSHLHMLRKEKLFSAVMANNGVVFNPWVIQPKPYLRYSKFVAKLGCPILCGTVKECLKSKSVKQITAASDAMKVFGDNPFNVFGPVVESSNVRDAFITETPEDIIRAGKTANVPFLIAYAEREGSYTAAEWLKLVNGKPQINSINDTNWLRYAPQMLFYNDTTPPAKLNQRSIELRRKYLGNLPFCEENYLQFEKMFTDLLYLNGIKKAICLHRKYAPGDLFVYEYKYPHKYGVANLLSKRTDYPSGADHGSDNIFTIPLKAVKPATLAVNELKIANQLCELYKSLLEGRPTYGGLALPLNTPQTSGKLTINEYCHDFEYCDDAHCGDCSEFE